MSDRYEGGFLQVTPPTTTEYVAPGVWTLEQALVRQKANEWPLGRDPYFNQTTLLLHGDSSYNSQGVCFADSSPNEFAITLNGDVRSTQFSPYMSPEGYWSNYFDGSDTLSIAQTTALDLGSGDFTIEAWIWPVSRSGNQRILAKQVAGGSYIFRLNATTGYPYLEIDGSGIVTATSAPDLNAWSHIAIVRNSNTVTIYINGVSAGSATYSGTPNAGSTTTYIASNANTNEFFTGYISNLRFVKGTAVYTSTFTPSGPLTAVANTQLLTCQSSRFVDNSTNNFAITVNGNTKVAALNPFDNTYDTVYGSGYFDGSGDYLLTSTGSVSVGTGDFLIECWVYPLDSGGDIIFDTRSGSNTNKPTIGRVSNLLTYQTSGVNRINAGSVPTGAWTHCRFIRNSGVVYGYVNGVNVGSTYSDSSDYGTITRFMLGADDDGSPNAYFYGYIASARFVLGTFSTSDFNVPTAPPTSDANTSLLTCTYSSPVNNNGFLDSGPYNYPITRLGNSTQGSFTPWSLDDGWWSNYFDGSGDYLSSASSSALQFGTGDFTVEFWMYPNTVNSTFRRVVTNNNGGVDATTLVIRLSNTNKMQIYVGATLFNSTTTFTANQWYHIALVRSSGTNYFYINGVQDGSPFASSADISKTSFYLGGYYTVGPAEFFDGYLSNVRAISGTALYTSAFTPPTAPLTAVSGTSLLTCQSNRFIDNSSNAFAITKNGDSKITNFSPFAPTDVYKPSINGGSGYFDGTGDWLTTSNTVGLGLSTQTWTISCWFYNTNSAGFHILSISPNTSNVSSFSIDGANSRPFLQIYTGGTNRVLYGGTTGSVRTNEWNHIALCHLGGGQYQFYLNGVAQTASSATGWYFNQSSAGTTTGIAVYSYNNTGLLTGYMSDLVVKPGVDGSVPTAPVTSDGSEYLLLNFQNAGVYDSTGKNNLETVADSKVDLSTVKYGLGSLKFDGTGDNLVIPASTAFQFTGDFTVEFWFNSNSNTTASHYDQIVGTIAGATTGYWRIGSEFNGAKELWFTWTTGTYNDIRTGFSISDSQWHHIAVTRASNSLRMFVDGVQKGTTTTVTTALTNNAALNIMYSPQSLDYTSGYIDDLRITNGVARYTADFTPPGGAFQSR